MFKSLITYLEPKSVASESFRTLRTNIQFANIDKEIRVLLITSSSPNEGKSTTTANLAISVAQSGKKVLIIDADIRKPCIHKFFSLHNQNGLTTVLTNQCGLTDTIQETEIENLYVLSGGKVPPNPSELIDSKKMSKLIDTVKNNFDLTIIDSPPINIITDAQLIASKVDGVILMACYRKTEKKSLIKAKERLDSINAPILGVVMTKVPPASIKEDKYGYYYNTTDDDFDDEE